MSNAIEDFSKTLTKLLKENNMTQRDLGKELLISDSMMSYYTKGKTFPSYDIIVKIAKYFNVTTDYLLNYESSDNVNLNKIINVPVFKDIKYNDTLTGDGVKNVEFYFPVVAERYKNCNSLFAKIVTTDEMNPRIMKNDIIIFEELKLGSDRIYDGDICLVSKGNEYVKIREMANTNDGYVFNPFNVNMPPRVYDMNRIRKENVHIIARAIKLIHEFKRGNNE